MRVRTYIGLKINLVQKVKHSFYYYAFFILAVESNLTAFFYYGVIMRIGLFFLGFLFVGNNFTMMDNRPTKEEFLKNFFDGTFTNIIDFTRYLVNVYPETHDLASSDVEVTAEGALAQGISSISMQIYNKHYGEFDRSVAGVWFLYLYVNKKYAETHALFAKPENKKWLDQAIAIFNEYFYTKGIIDREKIEALIVSLVLNDIGKVNKIHNLVGQAIDHDAVLSLMLNNQAKYSKYIPSFVALNDNQQQLIREYFSAGMSIPQLAQAENVPGSAINFVQLPRNIRVFGFWEAFFDVSGAGAHVQDFSKLQSVMNPFVLPTYLTAYGVISSQSWDLDRRANDTKAFELYWHTVDNVLLAKNLSDLFNVAYAPNSNSFFQLGRYTSKKDEAIRKEYCLARLIAQARISPANIESFKKDFESLTEEDQTILINGMSRDGISEKTMMIYYAPALFTSLGTDKKSALEILARLYNAGETLLQQNSSKIFTINIREIASPKIIGVAANKDALKNGEFHFNVNGDIAYAKLGGDAGRAKGQLSLDEDMENFSNDLLIIYSTNDVTSAIMVSHQ